MDIISVIVGFTIGWALTSAIFISVLALKGVIK